MRSIYPFPALKHAQVGMQLLKAARLDAAEKYMPARQPDASYLHPKCHRPQCHGFGQILWHSTYLRLGAFESLSCKDPGYNANQGQNATERKGDLKAKNISEQPNDDRAANRS